jgi:L-aminopeptidase/D-esterase-like protein
MHGIARAMKSGLGSASLRSGALVVGALAVVNAWGDVIDPRTGSIVAGLRDRPAGSGLPGTTQELMRAGSALRARERGAGRPSGRGGVPPPQSTTLGVVATNARLTKVEATSVARSAQAACARAIDPVWTRFDGDVVFCLARGNVRADALVVGALATEAMQEAILRAALLARSVPGLPAARDLVRAAAF